MERPRVTCRDTTWLVSDARERVLTEEERQGLQEHVATCPYCSRASVQFEMLFGQVENYFGRHNSGS
jgi:hypothetical protein